MQDVPETAVPVHQIHIIAPPIVGLPFVEIPEHIHGKLAVFFREQNLRLSFQLFFDILVVSHPDRVADQHDFLHKNTPPVQD